MQKVRSQVSTNRSCFEQSAVGALVRTQRTDIFKQQGLLSNQELALIFAANPVPVKAQNPGYRTA